MDVDGVNGEIAYVTEGNGLVLMDILDQAEHMLNTNAEGMALFPPLRIASVNRVVSKLHVNRKC